MLISSRKDATRFTAMYCMPALTRATPEVQQQAVGRGQQHLEEHEQVEQVAGQEGAVQAHQQELEQGMEMHPARSQRASA